MPRLVLSRKQNETTVITVPPSTEPTVIEVTVEKYVYRNDEFVPKLVLAFDAERHVQILRKELL